MTFHAVIFDMDGLMLDTEPRYRAAWLKALAEFGYIFTEDNYLSLVGLKRGDAEHALSVIFGSGFPREAFGIVCRDYEAAAMAATPLQKKPGLDELLAFLDSQNIPKAVATSTDRREAISRLSATGLLDHFKALATGDEVSRGKPAPDLFLLAATRLGVDPEFCLVLEDSEPGVTAAHAAGMQVYMVPDLKPPSAELRPLANGIFKTLGDVTRHLQSLPLGQT
jgi:HAD superfamily hydrolase (TIGR01509 family)